MMTWKQFVCGITGHSIITRSRAGQRYFACYACDRKLSRGWDLRDTRHQRFAKQPEEAREQTVTVPRVAQVKP
jgi:hypothetical protein